MGQSLVEHTCAEFAQALASKEPVPGGGGAAALAGALGAALCSMVGNFTTGKKTYAVEDDVCRMLAEANAVRTCLLELVDEDAKAFLPLSRAYAIPRDDPSRVRILEEATQGACAAPLQMMRQTCRAIELLEEMGQKGSRMLLSDVACGALLCRAALEAASINVFVNTRTLRDRDFADATEAEVDQMLATYVPRAEACATAITQRLRGE